MTVRKKISERMKVDALFWRYTIRCRVCRQPIFNADEREWDHIEPIAQGGEHAAWNIAPLHQACHEAKTRGTGATTAGSDIGKISKERRIIRTGKMAVVKPPMSTALMAVKAAHVAARSPRKSKYKRKVSGETVLR